MSAERDYRVRIIAPSSDGPTDRYFPTMDQAINIAEMIASSDRFELVIVERKNGGEWEKLVHYPPIFERR